LDFPADFPALLYHPWTLVTSLFVHNGFWHIFFNMFMLYVAGQLFLKYLTQKQLVATYFIGGIVGNLFFMGAYNLFPVFASAVSYATCVGASGAIMAILIAVTVYRPNHPLNLFLFGKTTMKWVAVIFVAIDLLSITGGNAGGHFAHLGGAVYGALAGLFYLKGNPFRQVVFERNERKGYRAPTGTTGRPVSDADYNAKKRQDEAKVDSILDKISKSGYDSLTKEERDFLYNYKR
jgi:membrane associated rhomboid family serine protease